MENKILLEKAKNETDLLRFKLLIDTTNVSNKLAVINLLLSNTESEIPIRFDKLTLMELSVTNDIAVAIAERYGKYFKDFLSLSDIDLLDIQEELIEGKEVKADFYEATKGLNNYEKYFIAELIMHRRRA